MEPPTVLVLDDDRDFLDLVGYVLEPEGFSLQLHGNPQDALVAFSMCHPHLILLDLNLGTTSGLEFLNNLPKKPEFPFSIVAVTGWGDTESIKKCYAAGVHFFLRKPVSMVELLGIVKAAVASQIDRRSILQKNRELETLNQSLEEARQDLLARTSVLEYIQNETYQLSILTLDKNLHYTYFNSLHYNQMKNLLGFELYPGLDVRKVLGEEVILQPIIKGCEEALNGFSNTQKMKVELPAQLSQFWEFRIAPFSNSNGQVQGVTLLGLEVTETESRVSQLQADQADLESEVAESQFQLTSMEFTLRLITDNIADLVVQIDENSKIFYISPSWTRHLSFMPSQLMGKALNDLIHPLDRGQFTQAIGSLFEKYDQSGIKLDELRILDSHGKYHWMDCRFRVFIHPLNQKKAGVLSFRDIGERKTMADFLRKTFSILQQSPLPFELMDTSCKVTFVNQAYISTFGLKELDVIGRPSRFFKGVFSEPISSHETLRQTVKLGSWRQECMQIKGNGDSFYCNQLLFPVKDSRNVVTDFMAFYDDLSERKSVEAELEKREQALLLQSRQAQMGELLNMIAHQWRQPLTVISSLVGNVELRSQMDSCDPEFLHIKMDKISQTVQILSETIESFRNFYSPTRVKTTEGLQSLVKRTLEIIQPSLVAKGISIQEPAPEPKIFVKVLAPEIMQVILELLSNARDALDRSEIHDRHIHLRVDQTADGTTSLSISNNGGAIDPDVISKIFLPYFTTKSTQGGTGLGLHMARIILEDHHGGSLKVSGRGEWVEFTMLFPRSQT